MKTFDDLVVGKVYLFVNPEPTKTERYFGWGMFQELNQEDMSVAVLAGDLYFGEHFLLLDKVLSAHGKKVWIKVLSPTKVGWLDVRDTELQYFQKTKT